METIFKKIVINNTENLVIWRNRYDKSEYPEKIVINIFYDLVPLPTLWKRLEPYFGQKQYQEYKQAFEKVFNEFRINQLSIQPNLLSMLKTGVRIGRLSSNSYDNLIKQAKNRSNEAIEELEYAYISRVSIKAAFIDWFAYGLLGLSKVEASNRVFSVQHPVKSYDDFNNVFESFALHTNSEISGFSKPDGTIVKASLYKPLPNFW